MINFCHITPTPFLEVFAPMSGAHLILAHLVESDPTYAKFYADLEFLLNTETSIEETFYYAAMIHLVFVKIHPWNDGNGRTARLLEKWFLAQKLGEKAWFVQSEKYYYQNHQAYNNNIRILGLEYDELDYSKSIPFLSMLANSVV
jgi:Fic family protein